MIFASGTMKVRAGKIEAAKTAMRTLMAATAKQPGCQAYVFSQSLEDSSLFHYFEKWDSPEALQANTASDYGAALWIRCGTPWRKPRRGNTKGLRSPA